MRTHQPCDLCGKPYAEGNQYWQHYVDALGHHHHRCAEHWQVLCISCGRMIRCVTHNVLSIDGWLIVDGRDAICPQVDEETVGELAARLCARAAQWWNDNETLEDE